MRTAKIVHCNAPKRSESKQAMLERYEKWELPEAWDACILAGDPAAFFNRSCDGAREQISYEERRVNWCLELAETFGVRCVQPYFASL
mmetsp:Transcript_17646/g.54017  ORF Transcript_17646/g.54017 Transcript_17646/m.54017 type:complete len:88 (+) Transcript_17646:42-305(+)